MTRVRGKRSIRAGKIEGGRKGRLAAEERTGGGGNKEEKEKSKLISP